jgi:tetratricopeptide (TPR) repeat protein
MSEKNVILNKLRTRILKDKFLRLPYIYLLLSVVVLFVYYQLLSFGLTGFDDKAIIDNAKSALQSKGVAETFRTDAYFNRGNENKFYRPFQNLTILVDISLQQDSYSVSHFTNIFLHLLVTISLFNLLSTLKYDQLLSLLLTMIYAVHPLFTFLVAWIPARGDLLITLFGLLSFIGFIKFLENGKFRYLAINMLALILAVTSKETATLFPLIFIFYFFIFKDKYRWRKISIRTIIILTASWLSINVIFFMVKRLVLNNDGIDIETNCMAIFQNLRNYPEYLAKFFIPSNLSGMSQYSDFGTGAGIVIILIITALLFIFRKTFETRIVILSIIWYIIFLLPIVVFSSTYIPTLEYWEHRVYLPIVGIIILSAEILSKVKVSNRMIHILIIIMLIWFIPLSQKNSLAYSNSLNFFDNIISKGNELPNAYYGRAVALNDSGDFARAILDLNKAIQLDSIYFRAYFKRGGIYKKMGNNDLAIKDFKRASEINPEFTDTHINLAECYYDKGNYPLSLRSLQKAMELDSANIRAVKLFELTSKKLQASGNLAE